MERWRIFSSARSTLASHASPFGSALTLSGSVVEDALGVRRGKLAAATRRAGLVQHRRPLPRRLGQVNGIHVIARPVMLHAVDFGGIGEDTVLLVAPHGAVFPARLPQLIDDGHVLVGGVVPTIMVGLGR